ncbi:MAG: alpha/beta hydrolase [Thiothrix sp.]|nr:alpha/beta hydrolase [Thiothrix sp.]HPQ94734.1 alpha/beta hydrolase [Thiolinea sp.]
MKALFVHGMGRSPLSGWPLLRVLQQAGLETQTFTYFVSRQDFATIRTRLRDRLLTLGQGGDYLLIGHSLGGVLLRAALQALPPEARRPQHLFLLGSPVQPSRLAGGLRDNPLFRLLCGDCGQLLGSAARMAAVGAPAVPVTAVVGDSAWPARISPFGDEANDTIVALPEVSADWVDTYVHVPLSHSFLPFSARVGRIVLERVGG